ncbi:hypothetical protein Pan153_25670 [Gimesia panareensis]|uniref:DUF1573 domain-containing protein n=1 Tax=Gimesia panareensis TaxID=2527978 RepID=A0A518FNI4_9PLAN|nr:DUF1573 domain-containing protein [Gimesia panareensis]QDV17911.1 hypothetical protein Pan153_25670 [Gimesia panareensis]
MNFRTVTTVVVLFIALAGTVWLGRTNSQLETAAPVKPAEEPEDDRPKIAPHGPYPKAVVDQPLFFFGSMAVGQSMSHKFIIKNEGEVPLEVKKGKTTCKCTLSEMQDNLIPPGESAEVELTWTPKAAQERFGQTATVYTNDPEKKEIKLQIEGTANSLISFTGDYQGSTNWSLPVMSSTKPVKFTGKIHTKYLDEFKILGIKTDHPGLSATFKPLTKQELKEVDAKTGYAIEVTASPDEFPLGGFTERLLLKTDIPNEPQHDHDHPEGSDHDHKHEAASGTRDFIVQVSGNHTGPIRIVPTFGIRWDPARMHLNLGEFPAAKGKEAILSMFVEGLDGPLEILDQKIEPGFLKFEIKKDDAFESTNKQRYILKFIVPAGEPAVSYGLGNLAKVKLRTNHPQAKNIEFKVQFISL